MPEVWEESSAVGVGLGDYEASWLGVWSDFFKYVHLRQLGTTTKEHDPCASTETHHIGREWHKSKGQLSPC